MPPFLLDDVENTVNLSGSWVTDPTGTLRHVPTGTRVSEQNGIVVDGHAYTLTPQDIDLDENSRLGAGASGVVLRGTIKATGLQVAIKGIKIEGKDKKEQLLNEVRSLVTAEWCPNLVTWYGGFISKSIVHVVLEYMDLGSLKNLTTRHHRTYPHYPGVPVQHCARISASAIDGLNFLHSKHIVHRDVKPENILHNSRGEVKLTDFGISRSLDATLAMAGTQIGTQIYMAPEMCMGEDYNFSVDIWAFGLVLYEMACGHFPFPPLSNFATLFDHICERPEPRLEAYIEYINRYGRPENGVYDEAAMVPIREEIVRQNLQVANLEGSQYPPALCDFVGKCLTRDVRRRPDGMTLCKHPFLQAVESQEGFAEYLATLAA